MKLSDAEIRELFQRSTARQESRDGCLGEDDLVRAAAGTISARERERVAAHIAQCSDCAREFHIARTLAPIQSAARRELAPKTSWLAFAAALLLAIALPALIRLIVLRQRDAATIDRLRTEVAAARRPVVVTATQPTAELQALRTTIAELSRPQVDVPIVDLDADVTRSANDSVTKISLPRTADIVTLILHLPQETNAPVEIEIEGSPPIQLAPQKNRSSITLALHRRQLKEGVQTITVHSGNRKTKFPFRIESP